MKEGEHSIPDVWLDEERKIKMHISGYDIRIFNESGQLLEINTWSSCPNHSITPFQLEYKFKDGQAKRICVIPPPHTS